MNLIPLTDCPEDLDLTFRLLAEREPHQSISHKKMPTWDEHCAFFRSNPYLAWYRFAAADGSQAGCVYLTRQREIGIGVLKAHRGQGLAKESIRELIKRHPGKFLANINPENLTSIWLFTEMGFKRVPQETYDLEGA
jgi:RimJ/RimL family protein N-acetyltransferase